MPSRASAHCVRCAGGRSDRPHAERRAEGRCSLVDPFHGCGDGPVARHDPAGLDRLRPAAAPERDVQALSTDPPFVDKARDIVGLYMSPPNRAIVSCVDGKSQIQALDREQPAPATAPGVAERRTHAYIRHGATSLLAALDIATGAAIGERRKRHRATEFLDFLKKIDAATPDGPDGRLAMDDSATHKTPKIKAWLARRPHWRARFTPTSASWIDQVERWFAELTRKQLQRGVHRSAAELEAGIAAFVEARNENPKPYRWVRSVDEIRSIRQAVPPANPAKPTWRTLDSGG